MEGLGFVVSPFDGCVFTLVTKGHNGKPKVHGCVGLHVDDRIGGGDNTLGRSLGSSVVSSSLGPTMKGILNSVGFDTISGTIGPLR